MQRFRKQITVSSLLILALAIMATPASAYNVAQTVMRFSAVAAETLATGNVVMLKTDGLAYKADANDAALRPAIGIIGSKGGATGATVEIIVIGTLSGWSGLTAGAPGFLSETAAAVTQSAPAYSQQVGQAITATTYLVNFQNYFDSSSLTVLGTQDGATPLVFEGATADAFETTVAITDPTADRTVTVADASGTVMLSTLATNAPDVGNSVTGASNGLVFEGATADAFETTMTVVDPTSDKTVTIPDKTGQVQMASAASVLTPGAAVTLTVGLSNLYTLAINDNEDTTITFSGAGTAGDEITIVIATGAGVVGDEVVTFHATLVSSVGTLTCANTATRFYAVRFISDGTHWYEVSRTAIQT